MIENITKFICKVDEEEFELHCKIGSKTNSAKIALFEFIKMIGNIEDQAIKQNEDPPIVENNEQPQIQE